MKSAARKDLENTDYDLKLYSQTHTDRLDLGEEPVWEDYYQLSATQRSSELAFVGAGALALGYAASRLL